MDHVCVWLAGGAKVGLVLAASSLLVWAARLAWLVHVDARLARTLARSRSLSSALQAALRSTGVARASCVVSELPIVFCAVTRSRDSAGLPRRLGRSSST